MLEVLSLCPSISGDVRIERSEPRAEERKSPPLRENEDSAERAERVREKVNTAVRQL